MTEELQYIEINPKKTPVATVIWLHGLGADGRDFVSLATDLQFSQDFPVRFIFPHAPIRSVTINNGYMMRAWFDVFGFEETSKQDEHGLQDAQIQLEQLLNQEKSRGIPSERIILGGFSQGGALALHCGLRYTKRLGGIIALSTYLPVANKISFELSEGNRSTKILMAHGEYDKLVPLRFGQFSYELLEQLGYKVEWLTYPIEHTVSQEEIQDIKGWVKKQFCDYNDCIEI